MVSLLSTAPEAQSSQLPCGKASLASLEELIASFEERSIEGHYFEWLKSRPADLSSVWLLLHNLRQPTTQFVPWISAAISRIDDSIIRCILVKQLYDELGNGEPDQCHIMLFDRLLTALEPWRPAAIANGEFDEFTLAAPGIKLKQRLEGYYNSSSAQVVIAASMVGEMYAEKFNRCLGEQMARSEGAISDYDLTWLTLHAVVEANHAGDSINLARRLEAMHASAGLIHMVAEEVWGHFIAFQDEMQALSETLL